MWKALLEGNPAGALLVDQDLRIQHANPALLARLGKNQGEILGAKCHEVLMGSGAPCASESRACPALTVFATAQPAGPAELRPQRKPGSLPEILEVRCFPLLDNQERLVGALEVIQDVTAQKLLEEYKEELALRDPITGLYNRKAYHLFLERELKRARRQGHPLTVCLVDIDCFKDYNEKHGDGEGDELLKRFGALLLRCTRKDVDQVFRLEADLFSLILPEAPAQASEPIRKRIRFSEKESGFPAPFSMAICVAGEGEPADTLHQRASEALFLAKRSGTDKLPS